MNALNHAASGSSAELNRMFLEHVLVWPGSAQAPGWINLHVNSPNKNPSDTSRKNNGGKPWVVGWPFKTVDDVLNRVSWVNTMAPTFYNVWVCMSQQSECTKKANDKLKAVRKTANATHLKSIWIDCDVKPGDAKHYHTFTEAFDALEAFRNKVGLPLPTAIVHTGGGFHLHWVSDTPLSVSDWRAYADGLKALLLREGIKCDTGLTTDAARILRVPGTLNHKYTPPRPVELLHFGTPYNFETTLLFLKQFNLAAQQRLHANSDNSSQHGEQRELIEPGAIFDAPDAAFAALAPDSALQDGIEKTGAFLVDPKPIFAKGGCAFLREAFQTGGRDYDNPQWNLSVLCTAFMENGNAFAHEISKGHPGYSPDDTQALYDRKVADRADRGIGYPSCSAIAGAGCALCQGCPHFENGKSPLNIRPALTATVNPSPTPQISLWSSTAMNVTFANIPHRRTLYGHDLIRGEVTVLGSPGGIGKSSLAIGIGVSIATGKELLGEKIYGTAHHVALINAEDSTTEIQRRVRACSMAHQVLEKDLARLHIAGVDHPGVQALSFLRTNAKNVSELDRSGLAALEELLVERRPDLLVLDPLVALCSNGNINDNSSMSLVIRELKRLAIQFDCAVLIVHHTRKGGEAGSAEAISGAASIVNLSRRAIMPVGITTTEADKLRVAAEERWRYFKLIDAKTNLAPRGIDPSIYRLHSIDLQNAEPPTYPFGDNVQAVVRVQLPAQNSAGGPNDDEKIRRAVINLVDRRKVIEGKPYPYSPSSAGADNARALLKDAMAAVRDATAPREWSTGALEGVVKDTIKELQKQKILVSDDIENLTDEPGRFRRGRGLRVDHSRIPNEGSDAADTKTAA